MMHRLESVEWNETEVKKPKGDDGKLEYNWFVDRYYYCVCGGWMTDIERQANQFEETEGHMQAFREHLEFQAWKETGQ